MRAAGVRLTTDDTGRGYCGLTRLLELQSHFITLDRELIRRVDADLAKRALASAFADFGSQIGAVVIAEGVATAEELRPVTAVGVDLVPGFYLPGARDAPAVRLPPSAPGSRDRRRPHRPLRAATALEKGGFDVVGEAADGVDGLAQPHNSRLRRECGGPVSKAVAVTDIAGLIDTLLGDLPRPGGDRVVDREKILADHGRPARTVR